MQPSALLRQYLFLYRRWNQKQWVLPAHSQIQIYKCADIFNYVTEVRKEIDVETKNIQNKIKKHKFFDEFLIKLKLIINIFLTIELISACLASFFPTFSVLASRSYTNNELMASLEIFAIMLLVIFIVNLILSCIIIWINRYLYIITLSCIYFM